jgi:hypothetical protein
MLLRSDIRRNNGAKAADERLTLALRITREPRERLDQKPELRPGTQPDQKGVSAPGAMQGTSTRRSLQDERERPTALTLDR